MVSTPWVSIGPAGSRINRDREEARLGCRDGSPQLGGPGTRVNESVPAVLGPRP